jgi:hypothetical protein
MGAGSFHRAAIRPAQRKFPALPGCGKEGGGDGIKAEHGLVIP